MSESVSQTINTNNNTSNMKNNFVWSASHDRELSRIDRYLRFGTEMNVIYCDRNSSFNAFIKVDNESKRIPHKRTLKSITNLWDSVKDFDQSVQKSVVNKIETLINSITEPFHENAISFVIISLIECQKPNIQSPFRLLGMRLILKPFVRPIDILVICKAFGRDGLNKSSRIRETISQYYSREFNDRQTEEFLVFGSKFGWTHKDVICLCHIKPNTLTKLILKKNEENESNEVQKRVAVFRSIKSKLPDVLTALDNTTLEPELWFRALNTVWRRKSEIWLKIVDSISDDKLMALIPRIICKFPNHKLLYDEISLKLKQNGPKFSQNFVKHYVLLYCEKSVPEIKNKMKPLCDSIRAVQIQKQISTPILVVFDSDLDFDEKLLSGLTSKKRKKTDLLDQMLVKDFYDLLIKSFNCYVCRNETYVELKTISMAKESNNPEYPFTSLTNQWKRRVIYVTKTQKDLKLWSEKPDEKLIVFHLNKIELKNLSYYRENVLIFNGFNLNLESIIAKFFGENIEKMDIN